MKATIKTINENGLNQIKTFLVENHKDGAIFDDNMISAWATDAEFQIGEGNPASIEIFRSDSVSGRTVEFTISDEGLDSEEVEIEE